MHLGANIETKVHYKERLCIHTSMLFRRWPNLSFGSYLYYFRI